MLFIGMKGFALAFDDRDCEPRGELTVFLEVAGDCGALTGENPNWIDLLPVEGVFRGIGSFLWRRLWNTLLSPGGRTVGLRISSSAFEPLLVVMPL